MRPLAVLFVLAVLMAGVTTAQAGSDTDLFTYLNGSARYPHARGNAEYELGAQREAEVTVTGIKRLAGRRVVVFISGQRVGTMLVSARGRAHRQWDTERGQSVPSASVGSRVKVRTRGGALIVSGRLRRDVDSD